MRIKHFFAAVGITLLTATSAMAATLTMTHTGTSSNGLTGTLDGVAFDTKAFTIFSTADTNDISSISVDHLTASISIDGLGTFDFITQTRTFANAGIVGFSRGGLSGADLFNGPSGNWDLMSDISLIGSANLLQWSGGPIVTTGGTLIFDNAAGVDATFTAVVGDASPVPLPAGGVLLLTGLAGLAAFRRRKTAYS